MAGFSNDVMYADNVDFSGGKSATVLLDGQLLIGSSVSPHIRVGTLTAGAGISITNGNGSILITNTGGGGGGGLTTLNAQSGAANQSGGVINVIGTTGITTIGAGMTLTLSPANDLAAIEALSGTGYAVRTGVETWALRTFQAGSGISLINADGASGNTTITADTNVPTTFSGDVGTATPAANNINIVGTGSTTTSASGSSVVVALTGMTNHAVLVGAGNATLTKLAVGSNGQVLIGATGADPAFATLTSSDSSISFTTGVNTLSLQVAGGTTVGKTITGDTGGALSPTAGNWNLLGTGSITTSGSGSTLTTQLTGLTNHAVLVGAGTATITKVGPTATAGQVLQSAGSSADPVFSTATYPATTTINQILYSSSNNVVAGITAANQSTLISSTSGVPSWVSMATDGKVLIGSTAGAPAAATLTAGTGISITNGSNSITIATNGSSVANTITGDSGGALSPTAGNFNIVGLSGSKTSGSGSTLTVKSPPFSQVGASATSSLNTGEFVTAAVTRTLPASAGLADGDLFIYVCTTSGALVIQAVSAQKIRLGTSLSSAAGTITSTAIGDSVTLRFNATDGFFYAVSSMGNWTVA